ncbi:MAG: flavodoxin domain-containing protein [Desulfosalsimonadaceae bacterium]
MNKVLVAYASRTGKTEQIAESISEGIRMAGHDADLVKISAVKTEKDLEGYDGYVFGCPTYHRDLTPGMKNFLFLAEKLNLVGKVGGAFGAYTHSGESAPMLFDTMEFVFKMNMVDLRALSLKEGIIGTDEALKAGQDYGKAIGEKFKK